MANEIEHGRGENGEYSSAKRITRSVLYTVGADGSGLRRLATTSGDYFDVIFGSPAWSPDGETIAFLRTEGGLGMTGLKLYTIRPDGSGLQELALLHGNVRSGQFLKPSLSWSPDGASILLGMGFVFVVNADGSGFREVAGAVVHPGRLTVRESLSRDDLIESRPTSSPRSHRTVRTSACW